MFYEEERILFFAQYLSSYHQENPYSLLTSKKFPKPVHENKSEDSTTLKVTTLKSNIPKTIVEILVKEISSNTTKTNSENLSFSNGHS
jgi:hypothetical protein